MYRPRTAHLLRPAQPLGVVVAMPQEMLGVVVVAAGMMEVAVVVSTTMARAMAMVAATAVVVVVVTRVAPREKVLAVHRRSSLPFDHLCPGLIVHPCMSRTFSTCHCTRRLSTQNGTRKCLRTPKLSSLR